jgi:hypothetical protein
MKHFISSTLVMVVMAVIFSSVSFAQEEADIKVENVVICTSVEDRQPIGADSVFNADIGKLYCFTKLTSQTDTAEISHVWFFGDTQMAKVDLPIRAKAWRTWSSKRILLDWIGDWRIEVQDSEGNVLYEIFFVIK